MDPDEYEKALSAHQQRIESDFKEVDADAINPALLQSPYTFNDDGFYSSMTDSTSLQSSIPSSLWTHDVFDYDSADQAWVDVAGPSTAPATAPAPVAKTEPTERRRQQNRVAQRRFRARNKLAKPAPTSEVAELKLVVDSLQKRVEELTETVRQLEAMVKR